MYNVNKGSANRAFSLFDAFGNADPRYLHEAYTVDGAEKLRELKKEEKLQKRGERSEYRFLYRAIASLVCIATVVGVILFAYIRENSTPSDSVWDGFEAIAGEIKIDGIDSLNYYSARRVLGVDETANGKDGGFYKLSYDTDTDKVDSAGDKGAGEGIFYYEFDPAWDYTVTKVIYFKAELKTPNGFLADKLGGIGAVDVIITENSIEDMITFKRGGRYYSCHINSGFSEGRAERLEFSTHKYIEGFGVVKNMEQDNYSLNVLIEKGEVVELDCDYGECVDGIWDLEADRIGVISGSSMTAEREVTFNITELESFFNSVVSNYAAELAAERKKRMPSEYKI